MVVANVLVVVEDVAALEGSDVSGTEEVVEVVVDVVVLVLLVVVVVSATGAGGKPCASTTLPDGTDVVVSAGAGAMVVATVSAAEVEVSDSLSLPEEQDAASKTADNAIAM